MVFIQYHTTPYHTIPHHTEIQKLTKPLTTQPYSNHPSPSPLPLQKMAELTSNQAMYLERLKTGFTKEKIIAEFLRRAIQSRIQLVSRWAMITRKMKKEEPSYDVLTDFTDLICYVNLLPRNVLLSTDYLSNVVLLLSSTHSTEAEQAATALWSIAWGDAACKAACVSATKPVLIRGDIPARIRSIIKNIV